MKAARLVVLLPIAALFAAAQTRSDRWAVVLQDAPVAEFAPTAEALRGKAAIHQRTRIEAAQRALRGEIADRGVLVTGAVQSLANAVFVIATDEQAEEIRSLPGVARVEEMRPIKRRMNRALDVVNAPAGWAAITGGVSNAGAGVKIAIIDTGIDQNHPAFQDPALSIPSGYPKCQQQDCPYTNSKVIAARSYVQQLVLGSEPDFSRPDDLTPRDRVGHGTASAMVAAGVRVSGQAATISGIAPKAWLGNYKVFGSPGVNDFTFNDVILTALDDAWQDGMDVALLSLGLPALWAPSDSGATCGNTGSAPCDVLVDGVERATTRGLVVVISAGNDGNTGLKAPAMNTINTPGSAPSVITVGASTNRHMFFSTVSATGGDAPSDLRTVRALLGDGPRLLSPLTAPLADVTAQGDDGKACSPLANGSLSGAIALIQRGGDCGFATKVINAQKAGAAGVIFYQSDGTDFLFPPVDLADTGIPAVLVGNTAGKSLKDFIASRPGRPVTIDPALKEYDADADIIAYFSSYGPSIGNSLIKPELTAVGTDLYMATQSYDPNSEMYDPSGYTVAQGTSFSAAMVAGAAALVKQRNPRLTPAQIKSAVVNTAADAVLDFDNTGKTFPASVAAEGNGRLNVEGAVKTNVTIEPATLSFGAIGSTLPTRSLRFTNIGSSAVSLSLRTAPSNSGPGLNLSQTSFSLSAGQSTQVNIALQSRPQAGSYEGFVIAQGGAVQLSVPYLFLISDNVPYNVAPLRGDGFTGVVNRYIPGRWITVKVTDRYGLPVQNVPVAFRPSGLVDVANKTTDELGIAEAKVFLGPQLGEQSFSCDVGQAGSAMTVYFDGRARLEPAIESSGVTNAASLRASDGVAPGSYISIFGRGLSDVTRVFSTPYLPLSLAGVSVSFDVPSKGLSLPGRIHFVSESQVNVQVPWELQGLPSAQMKVSLGDFSTALYSVPLKDTSPALFEYTEAGTGLQLAAARDENFQVIGSGNPVRRGRVVLLYVNGLGPVSNQPASGEPSPSSPLAVTLSTPDVSIGGRPAQVLFSGLAPGLVGLYQVNAVIPSDAGTGRQPVTISVNNAQSKASSLVVQ